MQKKIILYIILPLSLLCTSASEKTQFHSEYDLKLVFIEKFTQFIDWPESSNLSSKKSFIIGIYGSNPFGEYLNYLKKRTIKGLPVKIELLNNLNEIQDQNLLFISSDKSDEINEIIDYLKNKPILTISDSPSGEKKGVLINFYLENDKVKFYINNQKANNCNLMIHSPLLKIATIVN